MEPLSNIIKNYKPNSVEKDLEIVKQVLDSVAARYSTVRIYQHKIIVTTPDHIAATELRYKQKRLRAKLAKEGLDLGIVTRIA